MKLVVDWTACDGNGVCTIEVPELLSLDDQDNLVVECDTFDERLLPKVEAAVRICPKRALSVVR